MGTQDHQPPVLRLPETLAATLAPDVLGALEAALAPPAHLRAQQRVEFEVEAAGEGTFTITIDGGRVSAKKGFAREPLLSVVIPKGGWQLVRAHIQAALEDFPRAPELRRRWAAVRTPRAGELDALIADLKKLKDAAARIELEGAGSFAVARGPVDEATRVLVVKMDAAVVEGLLGGRALTGIPVQLSGDRSVLTAMAGAVAPALKRVSGP